MTRLFTRAPGGVVLIDMVVSAGIGGVQDITPLQTPRRSFPFAAMPATHEMAAAHEAGVPAAAGRARTRIVPTRAAQRPELRGLLPPALKTGNKSAISGAPRPESRQGDGLRVATAGGQIVDPSRSDSGAVGPTRSVRSRRRQPGAHGHPRERSGLADTVGEDREVGHVLVLGVVDDLVSFAGVETPEELLAAHRHPSTGLAVEKTRGSRRRPSKRSGCRTS